MYKKTYDYLQHLKQLISYSDISVIIRLTYITPSEGIEPPFQEPESYVLSITPRGQVIYIIAFIVIYLNMK